MLKTWWFKFIQFGFRLLYNEFAFMYDGVSYVVSIGAWSCWQRASLNFLPSSSQKPILELAHGTGNLQRALIDMGYSPIGLDLSPYMGRIAWRKLYRNPLLPPKLVRGRGQELPFRDNSFDVIVCTFPTNFILEPGTLAEANRVLTAKGTVVIVSNGILKGSGWVSAFLEWLFRITGQRQQVSVDIKEHLAKFGFQVSQTTVPCPNSEAIVLLLTKI